MSNAVRIVAYSSAVLLVLFVQQLCVRAAEDFPSDSSSAGDDFISYNQHTSSFSTDDTPLEINFDNDSDNQQQQDNDAYDDGEDDEIESKPSEKDDVVIVRKAYKDDDHDRIMYGDIIVKGYNDDGTEWDTDQDSSTTSSTTTTTTTTTTTIAPTTTTTTTTAASDWSDVDRDEPGRLGRKNGSKGYKNWLTNRKRRVHSVFDKYKAYHRNYNRYSHKGHKKSFGKYNKFEHHRIKHKDSISKQHHQQQQQKQHHHQHHQHHHRPHHQPPEHISESFSQPETYYYQGKVNYFGEDDYSLPPASFKDTVAIPATAPADKSFHLPAAKMRSYQRYEQYRRSGDDDFVRLSNNGYRSLDEHRYRNVKWPHLRRIEYQITKDERQEQSNDEDKLPPYIRKYNRRNKQLLDLLEGTMPPPSSTTTIVSSSSSSNSTPFALRYDETDDDDDYTFGTDRKREKSMHSGHSHYHNHKNPKWIMEDLFEEQRANPNNPNIEDDQYLNDSVMPSAPVSVANPQADASGTRKDTSAATISKDFVDSMEPEDSAEPANDEHLKSLLRNELPTGSVRISSSPDSQSSSSDDSKKPSGPSYVDSADSKLHDSRNIAIQPIQVHSKIPSTPVSEELKISPKANQFIYHRVASPRAVGTGTNIIGLDGGSKKQRLPFVAITDRRLETSKMSSKQTDFQQNHMPLP